MPKIKKITENTEPVALTPSQEEESIKALNKKVSKPVKKTVKSEDSAPAAEKTQTDGERGYFFGHGRRKTATARARLYPATKEIIVDGRKLEKGEIYVNNQPIEKYFPDALAKSLYQEIYRTTNTINRFITTVIVSGSGRSGQLGAVTLAISRALCVVDPKFRPILRKRDFLTRDPRMKERKKPGLMGARKQKSSPKR